MSVSNKKLKRKIIFLFPVFLLISIVIFGNNVNAASSKKAKALKAYKSFLSKYESAFKVQEFDYQTKNTESEKTVAQFLLVDMDHNKIPELVTIHNIAYKEFYINFYTYKKGKVIPIKNSKNKNAKIEAFSQAQGNYTVYACSKNHVHVNWNGGWIGHEEKIYQVKNNKLKLYLATEENYLNDTAYYRKNGKKITESKYSSLTSKCKIVKRSYFVKNNKKNRKKYLK